MSDKPIDCEEELKRLCGIMIDLLDDLKAKDLISEEEYHKHTKTKNKFLNKTINSSE